MVRKGIARGLVSRIDADLDRFFALYADNVHRHGTPPLAKRYFEMLYRTFDRDCEVLTVTEPGGKAVSSVLSFYFRDEVLPYYAGDVAAARDLAANDFRYWELLRRACERGLRVFDFGRSKRGTGPFAFKKNWGLEPTPLAYEYCLVPSRAHSGAQSAQPEVPGAYGTLAATAHSGGEPRRSASGQGPGVNEATPMETLLFLSHRLPYPPNKGDKVRSYHLLQALGAALPGPPGYLYRRSARLAACGRGARSVC